MLARGSRESTARVFSGIIRLWLEHIGMQVKDEMTDQSLPPMTSSLHGPTPMQQVSVKAVPKTFCSREKEAVMMKIMNSDTSLYHMLRFTTETAKQNATVRLGMLGAGSLALALTAFANADFKLSSLDTVSGEPPQGPKLEIGNSVNALPLSLAAINAEASTLSFFIHSPKFRKSWHGQRLETRLSLCSSLVFALLGRDEPPDEGYEVTRALFRKMFVVEL